LNTRKSPDCVARGSDNCRVNTGGQPHRPARPPNFLFTYFQFEQNYATNMRWRCCLISAIGIFSFGVIFLVGAGQTRAAIFTVDSSKSQLTISGQVSGYTFTAQGPGSLAAAYNGTIKATISGSTIQFTGSSAIAAINNGVWQPAPSGTPGSASADYGAQVQVFVLFFPVTSYGAARNIVVDLTSPLLTLTQTNFDSSKLIMSIVTNSSPVFDYYSSSASGSVALSGSATNSIPTGSSISTNGDLVRLVIQINTTLTDTNNDALTLTGQIVATNSLSAFVPPIITHLAVTNNQNLVLTVSNAYAQSQLLSSTNLTTWAPASATIKTNGGSIIFTTPMSGSHLYFRIQK
jgi:hypothetical protein